MPQITAIEHKGGFAFLVQSRTTKKLRNNLYVLKRLTCVWGKTFWSKNCYVAECISTECHIYVKYSTNKLHRKTFRKSLILQDTGTAQARLVTNRSTSMQSCDPTQRYKRVTHCRYSQQYRPRPLQYNTALVLRLPTNCCVLSANHSSLDCAT